MTTICEFKSYIDLKPLSWLDLIYVFFTTTSQEIKQKLAKTQNQELEVLDLDRDYNFQNDRSA